jgi:nitroreductase
MPTDPTANRATYEQLLALAQYRRSIRRFKPDPLPPGTAEKILEVARLSMSGANSQSWEFIVVQDKEQRRRVVEAYAHHTTLAAAMESTREQKYRHPAFNWPADMPFEEYKKSIQSMSLAWRDAPLLIIPLYDPRKQWGTVLAGHGEISWTQPQGSIGACTHGHMNMLIHLAAASLGLGSARIDLGGEEGRFREALGYPEPLHAGPIIPIGYRAYEPGPCGPSRWPLEKLVHYDRYDMSLYLKDEDFPKYILAIRELARAGYRVVIGEK